VTGLRRLAQRLFWARGALVFVLAFAALFFVVAGKTGGNRPDRPWYMMRPSSANHYVYLAQDWLDGNLHHEGNPPGYRRHEHHDWAWIMTLELDDGSSFRGFPCRTEGCRQFTKQTREETWWSLEDREWRDIPRRDIKKRVRTWYVSFPPGPALLMLPGVAVWGMGFLDILFTALLASAIPVVLMRLLDHARGTNDGRWIDHLIAAAAWALASPAVFIGTMGGVWFTAQAAGALFLMLYLSASWQTRRPLQAGLWLGLAMTCRPHLAFAILFFGLEWWREGRRWPTLLRFVIPFGMLGLALGLHNLARFDSFFEFGHRFLDTAWTARTQEYGLFNGVYLSRNLQCLFTLLPQAQNEFPYFKVSIHGMALPLSTPWVFAVFWARARFPQRAGLWLSALAVALPSLFYQNSGQVQFSYRFAVDWLPMVLVALMMGGATRGRWRYVFLALVVVAAIVHMVGTWEMIHKLMLMIVDDPRGWPFPEEFG
jgi:hypothetical protein